MAKQIPTYDLSINDDMKTIVEKVNTNFHRVAKNSNTVETIVSSHTDIKSHQSLTGTDLPDCHPISAITGLNKKLLSLEDVFPEHIVISGTFTEVPEYLTEKMTWVKVGSQSIGVKTINYFERVD